LVTRAIENAQKKVEARNFDIRKHLLEYDDVMNKQREVIYQQRREVLAGENHKEQVLEMVEGLARDIAQRYLVKDVHPSEWDLQGLGEAVYHQFNFRTRLSVAAGNGGTPAPEAVEDEIVEQVRQAYEAKERNLGSPLLRQLEKLIMLQTTDMLWKDHLLNMDHLKEGIGLRGYGQKNPLHEYQKEGFEMFEEMVNRIQEDEVKKLFTVEIAREGVVEEMEEHRRPQRMVLSHGDQEVERPRTTTVKRQASKVGRNDPCPCGSGKKYKRCCGK
jgi:preprotein translocase subunit SecA